MEETFSHMTFAIRWAYITNEAYDKLIEDIIELRRLLNGYIAFLKRSKLDEREPVTDLSNGQ